MKWLSSADRDVFISSIDRSAKTERAKKKHNNHTQLHSHLYIQLYTQTQYMLTDIMQKHWANANQFALCHGCSVNASHFYCLEIILHKWFNCGRVSVCCIIILLFLSSSFYLEHHNILRFVSVL